MCKNNGKYSMSKYILIIISTFLYTVQTNACREHVGFKNYPISQTKMFKHLVILKISHTEPTKKDIVQEENVVVLSYGKPFKFTATVLKSFKGTLKIGDEINGITSYDQEPNAVCPTNLMENETYIVMLNCNHPLFRST